MLDDLTLVNNVTNLDRLLRKSKLKHTAFFDGEIAVYIHGDCQYVYFEPIYYNYIDHNTFKELDYVISFPLNLILVSMQDIIDNIRKQYPDKFHSKRCFIVLYDKYMISLYDLQKVAIDCCTQEYKMSVQDAVNKRYCSVNIYPGQYRTLKIFK